jgi:hypothetical protein
VAFSVRIRLTESTGSNGNATNAIAHADAEYEYKTLELAREAAQAACKAAAGMMPRRSKVSSDEDWTDHPDRSDAADV